MLELTGTVNGKNYDQEIVSAATLIDLFNLDLKGENSVRFALNKNNPKVVTTNIADGKPRAAIGRTLVTFINTFYEGQNVQIRYYTSKIPLSGGKGFRYRPNRLEFYGESKRLMIDQSFEEIVFLSLFPQNQNSPLHNPRNHMAVFGNSDMVANAQRQLASDETKVEIIRNILNADDSSVVYTARAIRIGNKGISADEAEYPATAKVALIRLAEEHPLEVANAWRSQAVQSTGAIVDAIARGHVIKTTTKTGGTKFEWSPEFGGEEITTVPAKGDPIDHFVNFLANTNNWMDFQKILKGQDTGKVAEVANPVIQKKVVEPTVADMIAEAIENRILILHPTEDKAYLLDENQQMEGRALLKIGDRDNWRTELANNLKGPGLNRLKKRLS